MNEQISQNKNGNYKYKPNGSCGKVYLKKIPIIALVIY